jgi:hypothetical protein
VQYWSFAGASQPVQHVALAVMLLGQILPITPPAPNASWALNFWGPALQCNDAAAAEREKVWVNIWNTYNSTGEPYFYLSWVPWSPGDMEYFLDTLKTDHYLPFLFNVSGEAVTGPSSSLVSTYGPASLWTAVIPRMLNLTMGYPNIGGGSHPIFFDYENFEPCDYRMIQNLSEPIPGCNLGNASFVTAEFFFKDSTLLRCDLVNASYSVKFNYSTGVQNVQISPNISYSPMANTSQLFRGPFITPANCSMFQTSSYDASDNNTCGIDLDAVRLLSFQGIMAAFNEIVLGYIRSGAGVYSPENTTEVMKTILAETKELAPVQDSYFLEDFSDTSSNSGFTRFQATILNNTEWPYPSLVNSQLFNIRGDLKSTLEQLFQNFTISLLAEPSLQ